MIGVVGAPDSVSLVQQVADELELGEPLVTRTYEAPEEALQLAEELDLVSDVILFTGRLPYLIALASGSHRARLQYVPHEGTDLYRTLAGILLESKRGLPRLSLDSIDPELVGETFADLGLDPPEHVLELPLPGKRSGFDSSRLSGRHAELYGNGEVELCLTCVKSVHQELEKQGIPSVRIVHSRLVIREALRRASLAVQLAHAEAARLAVCVVELTPAARALDGSSASEGNVARDIGRRYAELLGGTVTSVERNEAVIHTSRGVVERQVRMETGDRSSLLRTEYRDMVNVGIGLGETAQTAGTHARRALAFAKRHRVPCLYTDDGVIIPIHGEGASIPSREARPRWRRTAEELGLAPATLHKLVEALRVLNPSAFTARQLAAAYGVQSRSARRLIADLDRVGLIESTGTEQGPGAGRPQTVYRFDPKKLMSLTGLADGPGDVADHATRANEG
jgi:hypothetical protein